MLFLRPKMEKPIRFRPHRPEPRPFAMPRRRRRPGARKAMPPFAPLMPLVPPRRRRRARPPRRLRAVRAF